MPVAAGIGQVNESVPLRGAGSGSAAAPTITTPGSRARSCQALQLAVRIVVHNATVVADDRSHVHLRQLCPGVATTRIPPATSRRSPSVSMWLTEVGRKLHRWPELRLLLLQLGPDEPRQLAAVDEGCLEFVCQYASASDPRQRCQ